MQTFHQVIVLIISTVVKNMMRNCEEVRYMPLFKIILMRNWREPFDVGNKKNKNVRPEIEKKETRPIQLDQI